MSGNISKIDLNKTDDSREELFLSGSHFLVVDYQEKANRLAKMMYIISMVESQIGLRRNHLETLTKGLEENKTKILKMQVEMDYYSKLTHVDAVTKASGMAYMCHEISMHDSQNTTYSNEIDQNRCILENEIQELEKMEVEMSEYRKLPIC